MMKTDERREISILYLGAFLLFLIFCPVVYAGDSHGGTTSQQTFVVGALLPLKGEYEDLGKAAKTALEIGAEQIANGSNLGVSIQLRICDNRGLKEETRRCLYNLIREGVDFIIGPMLTETALIAEDFTNENEIVIISPTASDPTVTDQGGGFMFSMANPDHINGELLSDAIFEQKKIKSFGTLPVVEGYGRGLEMSFSYHMLKKGVRQMAPLSKNQRYEGGPPLNEYASRLKSANVILVPLRGYDAGSAVTYLREKLKYRGILVGGDGWDTESFVKGARCPENCAANEGYFISLFTDQSPETKVNEIYKRLAAEYTARTGLSPNDAAVLSFDALGIVMQNIEKGMSPAELAQRIRDTNHYAGASGVVSFNGRQYATVPIHLMKYEKGKPVYQRTLGSQTQLLQSNPNPYSDVYLLFAHGYQSEPKDFDIFVEHAKTLGVPESQIFRTQVGKTDYARVRAKQLAQYINTLNIPDHSLIVIGHSMGGLDMRWMIGRGGTSDDPDGVMDKASRKIKAVYTIGTPHGGTYSGRYCSDNACYDLSIDHNFNDRDSLSYQYMYSRDQCNIRFTSLAFGALQPPNCGGACASEEAFFGLGETDGLVSRKKQIFFSKEGSNPPKWGDYQGCHCSGSAWPWELSQTDKLEMVLNDATSTPSCHW